MIISQVSYRTNGPLVCFFLEDLSCFFLIFIHFKDDEDMPRKRRVKFLKNSSTQLIHSRNRLCT